jgi:hypothetical protein
MPIAIEVDENKLLTWRTIGSWRLIAEHDKQTGGVNATQANTSIYSVSADVSGVSPVRVEAAR